MRKIINAIRDHQNTNKRFPYVSIHAPVRLEDNMNTVPSLIAYEYKLSVELGRSVLIPEQHMDKVPQMLSVVRSECAEYIYGEFRSLLVELNNAALDSPDFETRMKILEISGKIRKKMFEEGVR